MTPQQRKLARHALGLDGRRSQSYRNHFVTGEGSTDHPAWVQMVSDGLASRRRGGELTGGDDLFRLTPPGAVAALDPGETLCPEDFPAHLPTPRSPDKREEAMEFDVHNRWTGDVQFTAEIDCAEDAPRSVKLGLAVKWAVKNRAVLNGADLSGADLNGADLSRADLRRADLNGADLSGADLSRAVLRRADLRRADWIPKIENIHQRVYEVASAEGALDMGGWHKDGNFCGTTHCRAGWVTHLAGEGGRVLDGAYGTSAAAALIYMASDPSLERVPDFYCGNTEALADMKRLAEAEAAHLPTPRSPETMEAEMQMTQAALDVLSERKRQQETEGWTLEHDDEHDLFELSRAGACYALLAAGYQPDNAMIRKLWPFPDDALKPSDQRRRDLVKAAATILADIERLDRSPV